MKKLLSLLLPLLLFSLMSQAQFPTTLSNSGNDYTLTPQAAKAVINYKRFPRFNLDHEWIWWGPRFKKRTGAVGGWDDDYMRHGFSAQIPQLNYTGTGNDVENLRDVTDLAGSQLVGYILMPGNPGAMPGYLSGPYNSLPDSPLKTEIGKYINQLIPVTDEAAARQMGRWMGDAIKNSQCGGKTPKYVLIDEESARVDLHPAGEVSLRSFVGYLYLGIQEVCVGSKVFSYGPVVHYGYYGGYRDQGVAPGGIPWGENPQTAPNLWWYTGNGIDTGSPMAQALRANGGGVMAGDHYWRSTIGMGTLYQRSNGNYVLSNGRRVLRTDNYQTTLFGKTFTIYGNDPNQFNHNEHDYWANWIYEDLHNEESNRYWLNGQQYGLRKNDRSSDFAGVKLGAWYRTNTEEILAPGAGDQRPLNPQGLEMGVIFRSILHDTDLLWHGEYLQRGPTTFANGAIQFPGVTGNPGGYVTSLGQYEYILKGLHRVSQFEGRPWGNFYFIRPHRGVDVNADKWNEPAIRGKISETGNHVLIAAAWPIQDNAEPANGIAGDQARVDVWVNTGSWTSGSTHFTIIGRNTYLGAWQIPNVPQGVQILPQHLRFRFTNMYSVTTTWTGDYRFTASNSETMPASL